MKMLKLPGSCLARYPGVVLTAITLLITIPAAAAAAGQGKVLGMAFDGHQVSDLDKSVKFFETLDFQTAYRTGWQVDKTVNQLGGTKGAEYKVPYRIYLSLLSCANTGVSNATTGAASPLPISCPAIWT